MFFFNLILLPKATRNWLFLGVIGRRFWLDQFCFYFSYAFEKPKSIQNVIGVEIIVVPSDRHIRIGQFLIILVSAEEKNVFALLRVLLEEVVTGAVAILLSQNVHVSSKTFIT